MTAQAVADGVDVRGDVVLRAHAITKVYGGTHALRGVDFDIRAGAVTALFGENGAGKSTLMKILAGVETPTTGTLELFGEEVVLASPVEAVARGVAIIHQELNLCPNLSVTDNLFMGREVVRGLFVDDAAQRRVALDVLARLEEAIDPSVDVADLRLGQQQVVEIARAISLDARVLIMDEPTSALAVAEVEAVLALINRVKARGVGVVLITHRLQDLFRVCDRIAVMYEGQSVDDVPIGELDIETLVGLITRTGVGADPAGAPQTEQEATA